MPASVWPRRDILLGALALGAPAYARQAAAPAPPAPAEPAPLTPEALVTLDLTEDDGRRMRVQARVDGRGPFPFLVDTGADHSVVSLELARALELPMDGFARVNGIAGSQVQPRARVRRLEVGSFHLDDAALALLPRENVGALGIVGLDCLVGQNVGIDFVRRKMSVSKSRGFAEDPDSIVVRGKARFGRLMLVDSSIKRTPVYVVLDSGAQNSMGNEALRQLLNARRRSGHGVPDRDRAVQLTSVTGQVAWGDVDEMPELTLGPVTLHRVPIIYADLHTFRMYKLLDEPAILLGMDTLRVFARVGIDFARRDVSFQLLRA